MSVPNEIRKEQVFSKRGMGFLWANRSMIDPNQVLILDSLYKSKKSGSMIGKHNVVYKLAATGAGKLGYGRYYGTKGSLETLERECRGTLCQDYYYDVDIVNCHPVLLVQLARMRYQKDLPEVEAYNANREQVWREIGESKEEAKFQVIKVFFGGITTNERIKPIMNEVREFSKFLSTKEEYASLWEWAKKQDNKYGSFISVVLQTEERACMLSMLYSLERLGWSVDVLAYDGVMIRKKDGKELTPEQLSIVEKDVLRDTKYDVSIIIKPFSSYELPIATEDIVPGVAETDYQTMKDKFEENHFYNVPGDSICEVRDGVIHQYGLEHAQRYLGNTWNFKKSDRFDDTEDFLKLWMKDGKRRDIHVIDMKPSDDPTIYSPPLLFNYLKGEKVDDPTPYITLFNTYLTRLIPDVQSRELLVEWLAQLIQQPFVNPKTGIIIVGCMGGGKDFLGYLIGQHILGHNYYQSYGSNTQFWEKHDTGRMNKFFIQLEEVDGALSKLHESELKSRLTSDYWTFNPKNGKAITCANYARLFGTTNHPQSFCITSEERRMGIINSSNNLVGDSAFFETMAKMFHNPTGARVLAEYLMTIPIGKFPRNVQLTEAAQRMIQSQMSPMDRFIEEWDGVCCKTNELFSKYRSFCVDNELPHTNFSNIFGRDMVKYINSGKVSTKSPKNKAHYWKTNVTQPPEENHEG